MDYTIRPALKSEASEIASLIIEAMNRECCAYFYGPQHTLDEFHAFLTSLVEMEESQYSYLNTIVADSKAEVVGILISYDGAKLHQLRLAFIHGMLKHFGRDFSDITDETSAGELYLDSLSVKSSFRHQGIATALINTAIRRATALGIKRTGLLVDKGNPKAEKLYSQLGFKSARDSQWGGHAMRHMVYETI